MTGNRNIDGPEQSVDTDPLLAQRVRSNHCVQMFNGTLRVLNAGCAAALVIENLMAWSLAAANKSVNDPDVPDYLLMGSLLGTAGVVFLFEIAVEISKYVKKHDASHHIFPEWMKDVEHGHYKMAFPVYAAIISGNFIEFLDAIIQAALDKNDSTVISQVGAIVSLVAFMATLMYGLHSNHHVLTSKRNQVDEFQKSASTFYYLMLVISCLSIGSNVPSLADLSLGSFFPGYNAFNNSATLGASAAVSVSSLIPALAGIVLSKNSPHGAFLMDMTTPVGAFTGQADMLLALVSYANDQLGNTAGNTTSEQLPLSIQIVADLLLIAMIGLLLFQLVKPCVEQSKDVCKKPNKSNPEDKGQQTNFQMRISSSRLLHSSPLLEGSSEGYGTQKPATREAEPGSDDSDSTVVTVAHSNY